MPEQPSDNKYKLWQTLVDKNLYTKSYDDFGKQFSNDNSVNKLHDVLAEKGLYTKGKVDFINQFFSAPKQTEQPKPEGKPEPKSTGIGITAIKDKGPLSTYEDIRKGIQTKQADVNQEPKTSKNRFEDSMAKDMLNNYYFGAQLWNGLMESFESTTGAMAELSAKMLPSAGVGAPSTQPIEHKTSKQQMEDARKMRQELEKDVFGKVKFTVPDSEKSEIDVSDPFSMKTLKGVGILAARMIPDIAQAELTGGATFFLQGYGDGIKEYDEAVKNSNLKSDPNSREFFGLVNGTINGLLQKFTVDKIFHGAPKMLDNIKRKVVLDVISKIEQSGETYTAKAFEDLVTSETKKAVSSLGNVTKRYGMPIVVGGVTGAAMGVEKDAAKLATNLMQKENVFDPKDIKEHFWKNLANSSFSGAAMSGVLGSTVNLFENTNNHILGEVASAKTPEQLQKIKNDFTELMDKNGLGIDEKKIIYNNIDLYSEIKKTIPDHVSAENQVKIIPLIKNRKEIEKEIQLKQEVKKTIDDAFQTDSENDIKMLEDRRDGINQQIKDIINGKEEPLETTKDGITVRRPSEGEEMPMIEVGEKSKYGETEEGKSANKKVQDMGFDNVTHAINSVNKELGTNYKTIQEIPEEDLQKVSKLKTSPTEEETRLHQEATPEQRVDALNKTKQDYDTSRSGEGVGETPTEVPKDVLSKPVKEFGFGEVPDEQLSGFEKWRNDNREELERRLKSGERNEDIGETEEQFLRKKYCKGL